MAECSSITPYILQARTKSSDYINTLAEEL